ncbi:hypothetical protein AGDE_15947 [Angomonas deanei]|uniref:Amidase n=1 Tax=Angomonas deanei TaxID=59799 RepID=A0A7G2CQK9_9TRYP|nr:hypothetical protein AGDE_15947 [Angomonas deanei]CAD2221659.1 hypothetical protein, conserved [Angomonas deanei]|eukprot:EPY18074.1 hypothetical protein AGDE_15947 [Angomonas deanei]
MVGFKPTSQTIGSFSKPFRLTIPSASIGVAAARVDDLLFLWQTYTAALDVNIPPQKKKETSNSNNTTTSEQKESIETEKEAPEKKEEVAEAKATPGDHNSSSTVEASSSAPSSTTETSPPEGSTSGEEANKTPAEPHPQTAATSVGNHKATNAVRSQHSAYVAARDRTGDASTNSTKAILADIDVGWKDYNAIGMGADEFHLITNRPKRRWWLPSVIRRAVFGKKLEEDYLHIPRVELAIGYPAEWIDAHCAEMYGGAKGFHTLLNDAAYRRGTANLLSNRIEIIPIAFDFRLEDVQWSCNVIAQYELVRALESLYDHYSLAKGDAQSNRLQSIEAFLQELPPSIIEAVGKGQKLSKSAYENAWRVRDDVIRSSEEQFQDVDAFVLPLLAAPYTSGSPSSNLLTLPFHLGGHPMLSLQLDQRVPVGLVGELGRDAALLEDALRFVEFVRGDAPSWWRRTMFGAAATPTTVVKPAEETAGKETTEEKKEATP